MKLKTIFGISVNLSSKINMNSIIGVIIIIIISSRLSQRKNSCSLIANIESQKINVKNNYLMFLAIINSMILETIILSIILMFKFRKLFGMNEFRQSLFLMTSLLNFINYNNEN